MTVIQNGKSYWRTGTRDFEGTPIDLYRDEFGNVFLDVRPVVHLFSELDEVQAMAPGSGPVIVSIEIFTDQH